MEFVDDTTRIPIKSWCATPEANAYEQARHAANLPFAFHSFPIMADTHLGFGVPIGSVLATCGVVIPFAVGSDISCGMNAVKTDCMRKIRKSTVKKILSKLREVIPVGFDHHSTDQEWEGFKDAPDVQIVREQLSSARRQLGTLGSGNHFIEIQRSSDGHIWLMIHSGSRNFGYRIAETYHRKAKKLCGRWFSDIPTPDLSFLPIESREAKEYFEAMNFAMSFARASRSLMMTRFTEIVDEILGCNFLEVHDVHHNFARWENHFGKNVIVHRKGATSAKEGEVGIIPGSQGTKSYIVEGLGNRESFMSCSHGAGRTMGRNQARRELDFDREKEILDKQNIVHSIRNVSDLDEASGAYKDIETVMASQADLVDIKVELTPLGVMKG